MAFTVLKSDRARGPIRGVLFDMDGLVLDTEKLYGRFWREACAFYGFDMSWEQALEMRAANSRLGEANLHRFFGPGADYPAIRAKRTELLEAYIDIHGVEAKPGITELLDYLDAHKIPTAITSSSPTERIRRHLASLGLYHRFTQICSGYEVPNGKPAPDIYLRGTEVLGLPPEACLALEDAPTGIESAWRANCMAVIVPDLDQPSPDTLEKCYARADSLADVIDLIRSQNGE